MKHRTAETKGADAGGGKFVGTFLSTLRRRPVLRECAVVLGFVALTGLMTWPWLRHPLDTVSDPGDPYTIAYTLWWDYHQTFRDPRHLFDATIFYPYRDTLAFSEHDYGIALLFFPLFALGVPPLAVHSLATFSAFVLSGYGAFRLARTLTASYGAAWVAGVAFAFIPYRFQRLPHLHYIFAGWIPLLFEALVLFLRGRSWRRASWLGVAFLMNALTCISWFILSLIPLGLTAAFLAVWYKAWRGRALWPLLVRGAVALGAASLVLLPFLLPYRRVAAAFGFVRNAGEVKFYSANALNWLAASPRSKLWHGLGGVLATEEMSLFPGLLLPLLAFVALVLYNTRTRDDESNATHVDEREAGQTWWKRFATPAGLALLFLDALAIGAGFVAVLISAYGTVNFRIFNFQLGTATRPEAAFIACLAACVARASVALWPTARRIIARRFGEREDAATGRNFETFIVGAIWLVTGFVGSLGMHAFFHRFLFEHFEVFKSQRVPARWAMICYVGLALIAALGARKLAQVFGGRSGGRRALVFCVIILALLFELRVAPLEVSRGEAYPDALALRLRETPMRGGLVELRARDSIIFEHMIRAADHEKPIINAASSFQPPIAQRIESLLAQRPVPTAEFLDLLESVPASYLVMNYVQITLEEVAAMEQMLREGLRAGRLRFIRSYNDRGRKDLYAITKTEPGAVSDTQAPPPFISAEGDDAK